MRTDRHWHHQKLVCYARNHGVKASAGITLPPEISFRAPISGSLNSDLESSTDLQNWSSVQSIGTGSGETTITPAPLAHFYRLVGNTP